jgi:RimJ/RimL family protein N-acetyltransferase
MPAAVFIFGGAMFDIQSQLFEGQDIRFGYIDHDKDAELESKWTHDAEFMRMMEIKPARPLSPAMIKKQYDEIEKQSQDEHNLFYFTVRARAASPESEDRLIGKAAVEWIEWTNGNGWLRLGIGAAEDRRKGYGSQALQMLLRFAFSELNLFRVSALVPEYNEAATRLFGKFGFVEEVRRRKALNRDGRLWDLVVFGLLRSEWDSQPGVRE